MPQVQEQTKNQFGTLREWTFECSDVIPVTTNDFLVQIIHDVDISEGIYKVGLSNSQKQPTIDGTSQICVGQVYNLLDVPQGALVTWSGSLFLTYVVNPNKTSVTITNVLPGDFYSIQAMIDWNGCKYKVQRFFDSIGDDLASIDDITFEVDKDDQCRPRFMFSIPEVVGATSYEWTCESKTNSFMAVTEMEHQQKRSLY